MPTPVGPVEPDPDDPDFWDWGDEDDEDLRSRNQAWRLLVVCVIVFGLVLLLLVSVL
jgi:hypothetical protein